MICVCIGRGRHRHIIAEHAHLVSQGAQLVELRLDYVTGEVNLKRLLSERPGPVIISCRRERDGGKWAGREQERQMLLRTAIAEGVEYVDLEEDIAGQIPRFGKTKRIVSLHDFKKTPSNLAAIHSPLAALDADIVKLATMANHPHDNLRMLELVAASKIPTVGICMGEIGIPSRILAGKFGAPFTYATFHHERTLAPGQLSFQQMKTVYHYDQIDGNTEIYGVIADPVGHSLSPVIHNAAFRSQGLNKAYVPFRVPKQYLAEFFEDCRRLNVRGLSVTIPHKEAVLSLCTHIDVAVRGIGAANTVLFQDQQVIGHNTDYRAAMDSLQKAIDWPDEAHPLRGKSALILGAGGVARALAFGLKRRGANVFVAARSPEKATAFTRDLGCRLIDWDARYGITPDILINATPVGMHPNVDETPYEKHHLRPSMTVFDTVYNPEQTLLVKESRQKHCHVVTGVDMFVRQAALQFQYFTGQPAPTDLMRDVLKRTIGPVKYGEDVDQG